MPLPSTVHELWHHLDTVAGDALASLGLDRAVSFAAPPDPAMGDLGFPCFPYAKVLRRAPAQVAAELAGRIAADEVVAEAGATGPYVNLRIRVPALARAVLGQVHRQGERWAGDQVPTPETILIEYSSPNTNKPLHLGHVRNNLLGLAVSRLLAYLGHDVRTVNLVNDRGIHISKTMVAYRRWGGDATPADAGIKGDHFVGALYVRFDRELKAEHEAWKAAGGAGADDEDEFFNGPSQLGGEARELLRRWEAGDPEVLDLWRRMNGWVLEGFRRTYDRMGCRFDAFQYESETYQLGKAVVLEGLDTGIFRRREDGAAVLDLARVGFEGEKVLLRADGTSVYMTQDIGTALMRFRDLDPDRLIYVVGDEQLYHFQLLFRILGLVREGLAERCAHLAYGMIRLPEGRMKSREGTVVDADELMEELHRLAREEIATRSEAGKAHYDGMEEGERFLRAERIAQAALKFHMFRFTPRKSFEYNPRESIDFNGQTGPYCLYTYARTRSILRKAGAVELPWDGDAAATLSSTAERTVLWDLVAFPRVVRDAAAALDPSRVADSAFGLARDFNLLFADREGHPIVTCPDPALRQGRLLLAHATGVTLRAALGLLGIETLEEM
ncbi:MAG: arginine--tRNA ligase [Deltaproteobacteria bacterium]|nr:arginine--tRNA ligase [Deltaproteobacteria bacterium]